MFSLDIPARNATDAANRAAPGARRALRGDRLAKQLRGRGDRRRSSAPMAVTAEIAGSVAASRPVCRRVRHAAGRRCPRQGRWPTAQAAAGRRLRRRGAGHADCADRPRHARRIPRQRLSHLPGAPGARRNAGPASAHQDGAAQGAARRRYGRRPGRRGAADTRRAACPCCWPRTTTSMPCWPRRP